MRPSWPAGRRPTSCARPTSTTRHCAAGPPGCPRRAPPRARWPASSPRRARCSAAWSSTARSTPTRPTCCPPRACRSRSRARSSPMTSPRCSIASRPPRRWSSAIARCSSWPTRQGLRAEELVDLDVGSIEFDAEQVRVEGKGDKTRFVPAGEPALKALATYLERARPALSARDGNDGPVSVQERPAALHFGRPAPSEGVGAAGRDPGRRAPARPPALLRHPSPGGRRGPARDPGAPWTREYLDDPGLHSGRVSAPAGGVREEPSSGLGRPHWRPTSKR